MAGFFLHRGACHLAEEGRALPRGAIVVPRLPEAGERWCKKAGDWVFDPAIAADHAVPAGHVDLVHVIKMVEAAVITSGIVLTTGMLAEEAAMLGMPVDCLAASVMAKTADLRATEIARRRTKTGKG